MKPHFLHGFKLIPVLAAFVMALSLVGCASGPTEGTADYLEKRMALTDASSRGGSSYVPESPEIGGDSPFYSSGARSAAEESSNAEPPAESSGGEPSQEATPASASQSSVPKEEKSEASESEIESNPPPVQAAKGENVKAVWLSYLDLATMLTGKSEAEFCANIAHAFDNISEFGLNTVFAHVRPFADAIYKSEYYPWSYLATGTEGADPGYDPLAIMVREANRRGLRIEAWINPYRVRAKGSGKALCDENAAKIWLDDASGGAIEYDGVISFDPASEKARELIINGARELVRNYNMDGVHIDDYFYPHTDAAFDKLSYEAYKKSGGNLPLDDWRRENVLKLIKGMHDAIKSERPDATFGISPQSSLQNNYGAQYIDVAEIVSKPGYCDYVCPQVYFGFENDTQPFAKTMDIWSALIKTSSVKLYTGLAVYKAGLPDSYAGGGRSEWQNNDDLLYRMTIYAENLPNYGGFCLYRYDSLFNPEQGVKAHIENEKRRLQEIMR